MINYLNCAFIENVKLKVIYADLTLFLLLCQMQNQIFGPINSFLYGKYNLKYFAYRNLFILNMLIIQNISFK